MFLNLLHDIRLGKVEVGEGLSYCLCMYICTFFCILCINLSNAALPRRELFKIIEYFLECGVQMIH